MRCDLPWEDRSHFPSDEDTLYTIFDTKAGNELVSKLELMIALNNVKHSIAAGHIRLNYLLQIIRPEHFRDTPVYKAAMGFSFRDAETQAMVTKFLGPRIFSTQMRIQQMPSLRKYWVNLSKSEAEFKVSMVHPVRENGPRNLSHVMVSKATGWYPLPLENLVDGGLLFQLMKYFLRDMMVIREFNGLF